MDKLIQANYNLYLDDIRFPSDNQKEYIIVRNFDDFCYHIKTFGIPFFISFDHDLGDEEISIENPYGKTGYDCAKWLINWLQDNKFYTEINFQVHSMNPVGKENIENILNRWNNSIVSS